MNNLRADSLSRTTKLEMDEGRAQTVDEAHEIVAKYVLQIDVGDGVSDSATRQAMLLTAVNAARRAFLGGVRVRLHRNGPMSVRWAEGQDMATAVETVGGEVVKSLDCEYPTVVIGDVPERPPGKIVLFTTWQGWSGGIVEEPESRLPESLEFPLAGVLAAAFGVSEAFQHIRGSAVAGRRSVGLSLWQPQADWRDSIAYGDTCRYLPSRLWFVGLGHLGQAYAWALGLLPYSDASDVELMLQDYDSIVEANKSTGMLSNTSSVGRKKARVVAERLEGIGFKTTITERPFDLATHRCGNEPSLALVGVDALEPRRILEQADFDLVIDAGLGAGSENYLGILVHSFPSSIKAAEAWPNRPDVRANSVVSQPAYLNLHQQRKETTEQTDGEIECGIIEVAGTSAGAAFVGCVAATLVLSEALRFIAGGPRLEVLSFSLRSPHSVVAANNASPRPPVNLGFALAHLG